MKENKIIISIIITLFLFSVNSFSQSKNQAAANMAVKLQQKVLLTNEQTVQVKNILENYFQSNDKSALETAQKNIESLLDRRQKAKYDIIKNDWWNSIRKESSQLHN
jgi:hypothetical protein